MSTAGTRGRRRPITASVAAGAGWALLTACGAATTPGASHTAPSSNHSLSHVSTQAGAPTPASASTNKSQTLAETRHLINLVSLPPQATLQAAAPAALPGPVMGTPRSASLVDTPRFWHVPLSMQQSATWIAAHLPHGVSPSGSLQGSSVGYGYSDNQHSTAWQDATLDIGIAPDGAHGSYWRADGLALWLNPTPAIAPTAGNRLAITVAADCPTSDRGATNVPPGPKTSLLPPGTPVGGLICSYNGSNGAPFTLRSHALLGQSQAQHLARQATAINLAHTNGDVINCPWTTGQRP